jgi:hypothetical protein
MTPKLSLLTVFFIFGITIVTAQEDCVALLKGAVETTRVVCAPIEANQVCYGSRDVIVESELEVEFSEPGNIVGVSDVKSLETGMTDDAYGMALVRMQVYAFDTWETQEITLLAYGDVTLENHGQDGTLTTLDLTVSDSNGANVRAAPSTDAAIVDQLIVGETMKATGRLADNTWLRIALPDGRSGWVFSGAVTSSGELNTLAEVTPDDPAPDKL